MKQLDMTGIPFLLIVLVGVAVFYSYMVMLPSDAALPPSGSSAILKEGFQSINCNPKIVPMSPPLIAGAEPSLKSGVLVSAPYNEIASTAPTYYRDPAQETASRERIITAAAQLRAFLSFEAPLLRALSDPAVQLPLQQAKADLPRVEQELYFLQQNPGVQSQLKVSDLEEVDSNVAYLQRTFRTSVNTGVIQRPVSFQNSGISVLRNLVKNVTEGFITNTIPFSEAKQEIDTEINNSKDKLNRINDDMSRAPKNNLTSSLDGLKDRLTNISNKNDILPFLKFSRDELTNYKKIINDAIDKGIADLTKATSITQGLRINSISSEINSKSRAAATKYIKAGNLPAPGSFTVTGGGIATDKMTASASFAPATASASFAPATASASFAPADRATKTDLQNAESRLMTEMMRLTASGTNDPETNQRVSQIEQASQEINSISQQVLQNTMMEDEIPIRKDELDALFANSGDFNMPLGELTTTALPAELQNLLPTGLARDSESQQIVSQLADKYMDAFLKGTSFEFNLGIGGKYTSDNEAAAANKMNIVNVNFPQQGRLAGVDTAFAPLAPPMQATATQTTPNSTNLATAAGAPDLMPMPSQGTPTDPFAYDPRNRAYGNLAVNQASGFDWKARSKTICENARKRGLNPAEFGCLPDNAKVSADFSWRGYTKMICNRLQTDYYTGVPEACGCPPMSWPGWK